MTIVCVLIITMCFAESWYYCTRIFQQRAADCVVENAVNVEAYARGYRAVNKAARCNWNYNDRGSF